MDVDTGGLALQCAEHLCGVHLLDVFALDFHGCASNEFFLLDTVANYDNFVKLLVVFFEGEILGDCCAVGHRKSKLHILVADERGGNCLTAGWYVADDVVAVHICDGANRGALHKDVSTGKPRACLVEHLALHCALRRYVCRKGRHHCH